MKTIQTTTPETFKAAIQQNEYAIGALLVLYSHQTTDEQIARSVKHQNNLGFNGTDGGFCSSLVEQYLRNGKLTEKQMASVKKLLPKYHAQVKEISPKPITVSVPSEVIKQPKLAKIMKDIIQVSFPYDPNTVEKVKGISGRAWKKELKVWIVPLNGDSILSLVELGFTLHADRDTNIDKIIKDLGLALIDGKVTEIAKEKVDLSNFTIPGISATLRDYQKEGVLWIDEHKGRAIIGDDMGVGKTLQALSWIQLRKEIATPALILCPASAKLSWAREALKFTQLNPVTISGRKKKDFKAFTEIDKDLVYIINYDILFDYQECEFCKGTKLMHGEKCKKCNGKGKIPVLHKDIKKLGIQTVIIDEYHYLKTNGTARTESAKDLCKLAKHVVPMSGTPIEQKPIEIYNAIQITNPNIFPSWWAFTKEYCDRKRTPFGWDFSGSSNTKELHAILTKKLMIRRMKKEVLPELPPIIRSVVPIEINLNSYNKIVAEAQESLEKADAKAQHLTIIEKAKQAVVQLKMKDALSWVQDYIDSGQKIVVFAEHREVVDQIADHFGNVAVRLYGGTSQKAAQEAVDRFQTDPSCMVFVGSRSAKENHTLTAAAATCFFELWWMSTWHDQAEARVSRIGQVADTTFAYYLLAADTIEEDIAEMLDRKRAIVSAVLDGNDVEEEHMLSNLINKINGEKS